MNDQLVLLAFKKACEIREAETLIAENYNKGYIRCPVHLSIGQELVPSILFSFHDVNDFAISTHRSHAHYLGKGGSLQRFFDELHGLPSGCSGGKGGSMHLIDESVGFMGSTAIVGNSIPVGVGLAEAQKLSKSKNLTYIFLGDGATEEGVFYESINYAYVRKLPCLFIVENNEYSVYTPLKPRQSCLKLENKAKAFNAHYSQNLLHEYKSLFNAWSDAIKYVKSNAGPALIEVFTNRKLAHCGPEIDDNLGYRPQKFLSKWEKYNILDIYYKSLLEAGYSKKYLEDLISEIRQNCTNIYFKSEKKHIILRGLNES